ncbi:MAG: hypothetical protein JWL65_4727 [Gammaproteobacteria bacterium]|nr:hypothetical protein [Gammaproteobacteria bacterium]
MITRRTAVGAGLTFAAVACTAAVGAYGATTRRRREAGSIDALLIDETIEIPRQMAAFIEARQTLPVVGIQLDAAAHAGLRRVLNKSHAIVGISSGATLFCLERIAWDHGFRLTGRRQRCASDPDDDAFRQDVAAFLSGAQPAAASPSPRASAYRPSRADGMLHAWVMQKSASPQLRQGRRDV